MSQDDIERVKLFNEKAQKLSSSNFVGKIIAGESSITIAAKKGERVKVQARTPGESTDAFVLTLRMFIQDNERISIHNMSELYERLPVPEQTKEKFRKLRKHLNDTLDEPSMIQMNEKHFTKRELFETMLYGDLAHINPEKRKVVHEMKQFGLVYPLAKVEFESILVELLGTISEIAIVNTEVLSDLTKSRK